MLLINIMSKFGQKNSSYSSHKKATGINEDKDSMMFSRSFGQKKLPCASFPSAKIEAQQRTWNQVCLFSHKHNWVIKAATYGEKKTR